MGKDYHTDNATFMMYKEWEDLFDVLDTDEEVSKLIKALFAFAKRGEEAEFSGALKMAFVTMKNAIERDGQKWEKTCERNAENIKRRWNDKSANERIQPNTSVYERIQPYTVDTDKSRVDKNREDKNRVDEEQSRVDAAPTSSPTPTATGSDRRLTFGEFRHVRLTEKDHSKLQSEYPDHYEEYIRRLDEYIENKKAKYKNHYLTICQWLRKDGIKKRSETNAGNLSSAYGELI